MEDKIGDWREPKREAIGTKLRKLYKKVQQNEYERQMTDKESFEVWKTWMKSVWIYRTQSTVWKFYEFSVSKILREINFVIYGGFKICHFNKFRAFEFWFLWIFEQFEGCDLKHFKIQSH